MGNETFGKLETRAVRAGEPDPLIDGAISMPVFQSSTFEYRGEASYHDVRYIRLNNTPNHDMLARKLSALENGEAALVAASGMAAISTTLLTLLRAGDHFLAQSCLYGGTHHFVTSDLDGLGISHTFIDANDPASWKAHVRPNTKAIYVESITNPLMDVADLAAVPPFAKEHGLVSLIDNTFASPVNFHPIDHGFDLVLHSCTKYLNGHSDIVAGAVIGSVENVLAIRKKLNHFGGALDPHACFLLNRGIKTLVLRVERQNETALRLARFLEGHDAVASVGYPGLESHRQHARASELFAGFGGMLCFEINGGVEAADRFLARAVLPISAPSLGGVETLITRPATTSHVGMSPAERRRVGISDELIRLSVGIEAADDLIADFDQALRA